MGIYLIGLWVCGMLFGLARGRGGFEPEDTLYFFVWPVGIPFYLYLIFSKLSRGKGLLDPPFDKND
ncbi:MAG: hypothetical protein WC965_01510 [Thiohalomonadaceae bacterium]